VTSDTARLVGKILGVVVFAVFFFGPAGALAVVGWLSEPPDRSLTHRLFGATFCGLFGLLVSMLVGKFLVVVYDVFNEKEE
jgi:hypothetical protein